MTQEQALSILKTGTNVFLTGEPGSGKTYTINQYVSWLRSHRIEPAITASTGIAATHIGGITIHSWAGIEIYKFLSQELLERILGNNKIVSRITKASVLIIDEISMLDSRTLDVVDQVCQKIRKSNLAFGGLQVVFVGDFFQLPPITGRDEEQKAQFAFESEAWRASDPVVCYLSEQHRQEDAKFLDLLGQLRKGRAGEDVHEGLRSRLIDHDSAQTHVRLYAHNINVDRVNDEKLAEIPGEARIFEMESKGAKASVERLIKGCLSPEYLCLKIGARVMCTKNHFEKGFVNGTLGDVIGFDEEGQPIIKVVTGRTLHIPKMDWVTADGEKTIAKVTQYPLRLAWAITIHKSQGLTLDEAVMDLSEVFEFGQGYVALSRVRSFSGLHLLGYNHRALQVHPEILQRDEKFRLASRHAQDDYVNRTDGEMERLRNDFILTSGGRLDEQIIPIAFDDLKPRKKKKNAKTGSTYDETLALFKEGKTIREIAEARSFAPSTVSSHIEKLYMDGRIDKEEVKRLCSPSLLEELPRIQSAFRASEDGKLGPIFERFEGKFSYDELRLARMIG